MIFGIAGMVAAFWTSGSYLEKAQVVTGRVQMAVDALMLKSTPQPSSSYVLV